MKILVLNPMTKSSRNVVRDVVYGCWCNGKRIGGATVPPFTLLILTSILQRAGVDAIFLDAQAEQVSPAELEKKIPQFDVVVISTSTMSFQEDAQFLDQLKRINPSLQTIILGSHPTFMPEYCLAHPAIDFLIRHEPEFVLRDLIGCLAQKRDPINVKGIGLKKAGKPILTSQAPFIENLDDIPFPDIDLLPKGIDYFNPIVKRTPYITTTTSKGCPGKCIFCTAPTFDGERVRFQSADYVISEIEYFVGKGIREIYFRDDTFFINKAREAKIFNHIIQKRLDITWLANARVNLIDRETMELARKAGCHTIKFGIESGDQAILDAIKKGYKIEQAQMVFRWARQSGMRTHAHVMLGNLHETKKTIQKTIAFVLSLKPTTATFGICTPYPGTPLFDMVREAHPEIGDGSSSDLANLHVEGLFNEHFTDLKKDELSWSVKRAYQKFYLRPRYWFQAFRDQFESFDDVKRVSIAATNILDFIFRG